MAGSAKSTETSPALARLARNLVELMDRCRYSQRDLGRIVGVSQPMVSKWVNAENEPSFDQAAKIAEAFRVPMETLILADVPAIPPADLDVIRSVVDMIRRLGYEETHRRLLVIQQATMGQVIGPVAAVPKVVRDEPAVSESPGGKRRGRGG